MSKAQVANELQSYIEALAQAWPENDTSVIDTMATAIEREIPADTKHEDAIKARECAQRARKFGMTEKGWLYIVDAQAAFKDYMLFADALKGEIFTQAGKKKGSLEPQTVYINQLVSMNPARSTKELYALADKEKLKRKGKPVPFSTFQKKVSEAKNPK